jgi:hypothetical protein
MPILRRTSTGIFGSDLRRACRTTEIVTSTTTGSSISTDKHVAAFIRSVRSRTQPETNAEVGHHASIPGHLLNIAWRVGRKIRWNADNEQVPDDPAANALVTKKYRAPWKLEV